MKYRKLAGHVLLVLSVTLFAFPVFAGNYSGEDDASARCEKARKSLLAPEREKLISKCVAEKKDIVYCENYYRDYGSGGTGAGGKYRKRLYNDIPDCQAANKEAQTNRSTTQGLKRGSNAENFTTRDSGSGFINRDSDSRSSSRDINEGSSGREGSAPSSR